MRADATAATLFALVLLPPVRADGAAATLFARALLPLVRADAAAATVFAFALLPPVFTCRLLPAALVAGEGRAALPRRSPSIRAIHLLGRCAVSLISHREGREARARFGFSGFSGRRTAAAVVAFLEGEV